MKSQRGQILEAKNSRFLVAPFCQKSKKGQIGETMTWVVATIVIIVILGVSVFAATLSPIKSSKEFKSNRKADLLATKSLINYLSSGEDGALYTKLRGGEKLGDSKKVIEELYEGDYHGEADLYLANNKDVYVLEEAFIAECDVESRIKLNNQQNILLCLGRK
ncbi:MAG: hypothetical protein ABIJ14_02060 [Nanoarchaeota archaeon]|nr:hypothetical protein [Nanoarchaeota archaeon]